MTIIVNRFGKFKYNMLPGMLTLVYIVQDKVDKILDDIKDVKTYINDI